MCLSGLRGRGQGLGLQRERRQSQEDEKRAYVWETNVCWAM